MKEDCLVGDFVPERDFGTRSLFTAFGLTRSLFTAFGLHESRGRKVGAAREREMIGGTWDKVRKKVGLVEDCEELGHLQRKYTRKGREWQEGVT